MSKYHSTSYNYVPRPASLSTTRSLACENCGRTHLYKEGTKPPTDCASCGHPYDEPVPINTHASEKAKPTTHNQMRIYCQACKYRAVVWVSKKKRPTCPKCGESGYKIRSAKLRPEGDCKTGELWENQGYGHRPHGLNTKPKKLRFCCPECGCPHFYLIKPPDTCRSCKKDMTNDKSQISVSA